MEALPPQANDDASSEHAKFAGRDVNLVATELGIEESVIRFLEHEYSDIFERNAVDLNSRHYDERRVRLLQAVHQLLMTEDCSPKDVRRHLGCSENGTGNCRVVAITSGKGGVGKTTVALNLALAFVLEGRRTLVIDADLGLANVHVLAGINPKVTLLDVVEGRVSLNNAITDGPAGVRILCGCSGVSRMAERSKRLAAIISSQLQFLAAKFDRIIIDTGAGISRQVVRFLEIAEDIVVIATPDLSSTLDAYSVIKTVHEKRFKGRIHLLANQAPDEASATAIANKINTCAAKFLNGSTSYLGFIPAEDIVRRAGQTRIPLLISHPESITARNIGIAAENLLYMETADLGQILTETSQTAVGTRPDRATGN
jgi:flagellar biosynthesis protein FlhG